MQLSDFDYSLPKKFIAQKPLEKRDQSRLMVLNREKQLISHHQFFELPDLLDKNTVLVFNESKVLPARLKFKIGEGKAELLLIKSIGKDTWECMVKPGPKFIPQSEIIIDSELSCRIESITTNGLRVIKFYCDNFKEYLNKNGHTPLPPYIKEDIDNPDKYQTIYAKNEGSVAAPTAGFHFTDDVFSKLKEKGIHTEFINLHVGLGTFQPVKTNKIEDHKMHSEFFELSKDTAERLNKSKRDGKKIIAVGTTSIRVLESCSNEKGELTPKTGETDIFIYPKYKWKYIDGIITNFHVPKSTLLMLISSFASHEFILNAYEEAKLKNYRFFSFGDSMLIV